MGSIREKNRGRKSRDMAPLSDIYNTDELNCNVFIYILQTSRCDLLCANIFAYLQTFAKPLKQDKKSGRKNNENVGLLYPTVIVVHNHSSWYSSQTTRFPHFTYATNTVPTLRYMYTL